MNSAGFLTGNDWDDDLGVFLESPTISNYLSMRRLYPNREPAGWWFSGYDPLRTMSEELAKWGISVRDVAAAMDADHQAIDRVALRLLELLAERENSRQQGETQLGRRGAAIPNALVNYLIIILLEGMAEYDEPANIGSLNFLIREQLGGPRMAKSEAAAKELRRTTIVGMIVSAKRIPGFKEPSLREIAKALNINVSSIHRMFEPGELDQLVSAEMQRCDQEGPLLDQQSVIDSEEVRALHRNMREQHP